MAMVFTLDNMLSCEWRGKRISPLSAKVLYVLFFRKGEWIAREDIIDFIYPNPDTQPLWAQSHIRAAIGKIRRLFGFSIIKTNYKRGYQV